MPSFVRKLNARIQQVLSSLQWRNSNKNVVFVRAIVFCSCRPAGRPFLSFPFHLFRNWLWSGEFILSFWRRIYVHVFASARTRSFFFDETRRWLSLNTWYNSGFTWSRYLLCLNSYLIGVDGIDLPVSASESGFTGSLERSVLGIILKKKMTIF